jgi:putative hydrolase of the HAD superfamily
VKAEAPTRGIAFDWGGIFTEGTFDSDAVRNLAELCDASEEQVSETYFPLMAEFESGAFGLDEFAARFRQESGLSFGDQEFRRTFLASGRERPQMYRLLAAIPDRYVVGMLSNNVAELCDRVRDDQRMARVERFLFSNELRLRKPDARAFAALAEALELPPQQIVFIDDSAENIRACRELGFKGIHLRDFTSFSHELARFAPDVTMSGSDE